MKLLGHSTRGYVQQAKPRGFWQFGHNTIIFLIKILNKQICVFITHMTIVLMYV